MSLSNLEADLKELVEELRNASNATSSFFNTYYDEGYQNGCKFAFEELEVLLKKHKQS